MSKSKRIDLICGIGAVAMVLVTLLVLGGGGTFLQAAAADMPYVSKLFSTNRVHQIDLVADEDDWSAMLENATAEEYISCTAVIDGEKYANVGIRPKGNSSLRTVANSDSDRYSFKLEFDRYDKNSTYHGLDKLCLNNAIQDNTYMKDLLCYQMMNWLGADAPLSSFVWITVNGEDWGLYTAVEGIEDSFAQREYGTAHGQIYKPDSMDMGGGGRGAEARNRAEETETAAENTAAAGKKAGGFASMATDLLSALQEENGSYPEEVQAILDEISAGTLTLPADLSTVIDRLEEAGIELPETLPGLGDAGGLPQTGRGMKEGNGGGMESSEDVLLRYSDDDPESYPNIFDNAVFDDVTEPDKAQLVQSLKALNEGDVESSVNIDEVLRYFAVHNFVLNGDSYTGSIIHNYYLYEDNGLLSMIAWDYNLAFGGMDMGGMGAGGATSTVNSPIDSPVSSGDISQRPMVAWIFNSEEYTERYHQVMDELISGFFESGAFETMIEETVEMISPYVEKDPTAFCTYEEFQKGVETLKEFCLLRAESVRGQLNGTIPSTSEGQSEDISGFVDASHITVSDMGSQGSGMGMERGFGRSFDGLEADGAGNPEESGEETGEAMLPAADAPKAAEDGIQPPGEQGGMAPPEGEGDNGPFAMQGGEPPQGMEGGPFGSQENGEGFPGRMENREGFEEPAENEGTEPAVPEENPPQESISPESSPEEPGEGEAQEKETGQANGTRQNEGEQNSPADNFHGGMDLPGVPGQMPGGEPAASGSLETWLLLGGSALLLLAGLLFAKFYR